MNGFVDQIEKAKGCQLGETRCLSCAVAPGAEQCIDVMSYRDAREIPNYWEYASHFVLQDNMFESQASWSLPEHLALVSAWSAICPTGDSNPLDCASGLYDVSNTNKNVTVKARWTDITYLLHRAGVSWRYYLVKGIIPDCEFDEAVECKESTKQTPTTSGNWNPLRDFADVANDEELGNIQSLNRFYEAVHATSCGLPNVSWVVPNQEVSEHPRASIKRGQAYVTTLVNAIMRSPCWSSTAILLSWDDWGGFYDSVPPPVIDENGYGLRVPGLVISPYARAGYIDHQLLSHDAYLKFIEDDFLAGQRLDPATDGRPDSRPDVREANPELGDLAADFDFTQEPQPPLILATHPEPGPASEPPK